MERNGSNLAEEIYGSYMYIFQHLFYDKQVKDMIHQEDLRYTEFLKKNMNLIQHIEKYITQAFNLPLYHL